jgi:trehalose 6-phosphate phosphatase
MTEASALRRLWVFDFDGTLSPLVPERAAAALHPACRDVLAQLAGSPRELVSVLSSRSLDDLAARVPVPSVLLGGGSGLEWRLPGTGRVLPGDDAERRLERVRARMAAWLDGFRGIPGIDIEDKRWSVAIHFRRVPRESRGDVTRLLRELERRPGLRIFRGPEAAEVQLLRDGDKSFGIRRICRLLPFDPSAGRIVYAGDDENDAVAMRWVMARKGTALVVGDRLAVPGAIPVDGPKELAAAVRGLAGVAPPGRKGTGQEIAAG